MGPAKQVILGVNPVGADAYHQVYQVCMLCQQVKVCTAILHSAQLRLQQSQPSSQHMTQEDLIRVLGGYNDKNEKKLQKTETCLLYRRRHHKLWQWAIGPSLMEDRYP